jgi:hypothetical protein
MKKMIIKLVQKYLLKTNPKIRNGDLVLFGDGDRAFEAVGVYYSYELQPFVFMRSMDDGKIIGAPMDQCRSPYTN